jgi:hypothetical protein
MTQALILVNGVAASDDDLPISTLVTLSNQNNGGELTYAWTITYQPPGTADVLSAPAAAVTLLTPQKEGNYRIQLVVNASLPDERVATAIVGVRQLTSALSQPAAGETTETGPFGWAVSMDAVVRRVSALSSDPGRIAVVNVDGSPLGTPMVASATATLKAGIPNTEILIAVESAASVSHTIGARSFLVVLEATIDGGAIVAGGLCYARFYGICGTIPTASIAGAPSVGDLIFLATAGAYTSVAPADPQYRAVGVYLGVNPLIPANALISVNLGAYAPAGGGGGSDILWEWNGVDTTQFLPKVDIGLGAGIAGLTLAVVAGGPNGSLLRAGSTELVAGGVIFPINFAFPRRYVIEVTFYSLNFTDVTTAGNNICGTTVVSDNTCLNSINLAHTNITAAVPEMYAADYALAGFGAPFGPSINYPGALLSAAWCAGFGGPQTGLSVRYTVNTERPFVAATPAITILAEGCGPNQAPPGTAERINLSAQNAGPYPVAWNAAVLDTLGLIVGNGAATTAWTVDIESFRVLAHPADR